MRMVSRSLVGSALALICVSVAGMVASSTTPSAGDTGEQVVAWFVANRDSARWFVWVGTVSTPLFAIVVANLRQLLPAPHRDVFLIGATAVLVCTAVQSWVFGGLALHPDRLEPATARAVLDVAMFYGPVLTGATVTMIAPVTLLSLRGDGRLPKWLGILGAATVVEQAVETVTIFGTTGFTQPGGAMNMQLGAAMVMAWLLAFAIWAGIHGVASGDGSGEA
jgi:hypothetical protein